MKDRLRAASVRLYGEPPSQDAPRSQRFRYVQRLYLRLLPFALPAYACVFVFARQTWVFVVIGIGALVWLQGLVSISFRIRREERKERVP
jgi:hypothetical protein